MRVLVTGAAGFIGSNYVHHLLANSDDIEVISLDALTYAGDLSNLDELPDSSRHTFVEGTIQDRDLVSDLVEDVEFVVNFAAESHVDRAIEGSSKFVSTNVAGTQTLLDVARDTDLDGFIQVSTDEVYGEIAEGKFSEDDRLTPRNPYAATKAAADHLAYSYYITYDVPIKITRSSNNYGPRQHPEKLIPKFIRRAQQGKSLPVYGDGSNVREWIYVTDNCRAIEAVRSNGTTGEIYNIGSGEEMTNISVTKKIIDAVGASEELIEFVEDRPGHDSRYSLDTSKITDLGWEPEVSFDTGLSETVDYYTE
jgi:dTDP-glucose 4,6-dehydratase